MSHIFTKNNAFAAEDSLFACSQGSAFVFIACISKANKLLGGKSAAPPLRINSNEIPQGLFPKINAGWISTRLFLTSFNL